MLHLLERVYIHPAMRSRTGAEVPGLGSGAEARVRLEKTK
jgi:hypothetical protein